MTLFELDPCSWTTIALVIACFLLGASRAAARSDPRDWVPALCFLLVTHEVQRSTFGPFGGTIAGVLEEHQPRIALAVAIAAAATAVAGACRLRGRPVPPERAALNVAVLACCWVALWCVLAAVGTYSRQFFWLYPEQASIASWRTKEFFGIIGLLSTAFVEFVLGSLCVRDLYRALVILRRAQRMTSHGQARAAP